MRIPRVAISVLLLSLAQVAAAQEKTRDEPLARVYIEAEVSQPVTVLKEVRVTYPDSLRAAKVGGLVLAQWVVDTTGRALATTFKVLRSPHSSLSDAVRTAALAMEFSPALVQGKKVRQLVQMPFQFRP